MKQLKKGNKQQFAKQNLLSHHLHSDGEWSSVFIFNLAFQSQIFFIILQWLLSDLIPNHIPDGVFESIKYKEIDSQTDIIIKKIFGTFEKWDAAYFLHIALHGYTYENTTAFFPLFPTLVRVVGVFIFFATFRTLTLYSCFILSAFLINVVCFSLSAVVLYKLALKLSNKDFSFSSLAVVLFLVNPARVFFISPYSESLFSFTTFLGLLSLYDDWNFKASIFFALSALTRSNGILNLGFLIHKYISHMYITYFQNIRRKRILFFPLMRDISCFSFAMGFVITPFLYYQLYIKALFCDAQNSKAAIPHYITSYAEIQGYVLPGRSLGSHCKSYEMIYSYVQRHYWNVGFLKYFQFKQIPNFLLATPILLLVFYSSYVYFIKWKKIDLICNGKVLENKYYTGKYFNENSLISYYLHLSALGLFCFFCVHVQVSTRMLLSSSPLIYFIVAKYVTEKSHLTKYCISYFCSYCILGVLLFTNNYPWI